MRRFSSRDPGSVVEKNGEAAVELDESFATRFDEFAIQVAHIGARDVVFASSTSAQSSRNSRHVLRAV